MFKIFSLEEKKEFIDLYYNDLVGLQCSKTYINAHLKSKAHQVKPLSSISQLFFVESEQIISDIDEKNE